MGNTSSCFDYPAESVKPGSEADTTVRALADHFAETGQPNKAIELYQELRRKIMASNPSPQNDLLNAAHVSQLDASLARHWDSKLPGHPFVQQQLAAKSVL